MALAPLDRPASSTQVLRYRGAITVGGASTVYPQASAVTPSDAQISGANFIAWVRFPLFEATPAVDLTNTATRLPQNVFDDEAPAGAAPHSTVACIASVGPATGVNATDLSMNAQSWAENLEIHFNNIDTKVVLCDAAVSVDNDGANGALVVLDNATTSGLGRGTGLPVVLVKFTVAANEGAPQTFNVDITFEIRHSDHR